MIVITASIISQACFAMQIFNTGAPAHLSGDILQWVLKHFQSPAWQKRVVIASDITRIKGDILIDCNPDPQKDGSEINAVYDFVLKFRRNFL